MSNLRKLGTIGSLGLLVSSTLLFGSANAAMAATCRTGVATPTSTLTGTVVAATNFERNTLSPFVASTSGNGTAAVTSPTAHSGTCSARLIATADPGSVARMSVSLASGTKRANADAWVNIKTPGLAGNNVPFVRFFSGSTRIVDVFRNNSNGQLWLRITNPNGTFSYLKLRPSSVPLSTWHRVQMQVRANGSTSTVQVWFDGASVLSRSVSLGATSLSKVQFGAEHPRQMGESYIDDVVVKRATS